MEQNNVTPLEDHPHCCNGHGWVALGEIIVDEESGEELERILIVPCQRCASLGSDDAA